jgi:hypothetical protein
MVCIICEHEKTLGWVGGENAELILGYQKQIMIFVSFATLFLATGSSNQASTRNEMSMSGSAVHLLFQRNIGFP